MSENLSFWRKCTTCKKHIGFRQKYWVCSVSTCNRVRTDLVFCDLKCFDAHVPVLNHRDAGAYERTSPATATPALTSVNAIGHSNGRTESERQAIVRKLPSVAAPQGASHTTSVPVRSFAVSSRSDEGEILVVVSKVKNYIRSQSGMNTSDSVMNLLSKYVRRFADQAIQSAERHGRKTVLDRDIS